MDNRLRGGEYNPQSAAKYSELPGAANMVFYLARREKDVDIALLLSAPEHIIYVLDIAYWHTTGGVGNERHSGQ